MQPPTGNDEQRGVLLNSPPDDVATIVARLRTAGCVFAEDEARLLVDQAGTAAELESMVARRVDGVPLEQVLGWAEFCGLRIRVEPGVFVPRRRTELLVAQAASLAGPGAVVVDLCCGSGAVGAALLALRPTVEVHATDVDPAAVRCSRTNMTGPRAQVYQGDLFAALPSALRGRVDVLVANAPYVPTRAIATMPPEARLHEPRLALDGGPGGMTVQLRIAAEAAGWLAPDGHLLIETSQALADDLASVFARHGLSPHVVRSDELDATVVTGTRSNHR